MTFDMLETFLLLTKTNSFSRTAEMLFVSQSTVTARIHMLEQELGQELFARDSKNVRLTTPGSIFMDYAKKLVKLSSDSVLAMQNYNRFQYKMTIAAQDSVWERYLFEPMTEYMQQNTHITFQLYCGHSDFIIEGLLDGMIDLGVALNKTYHTEIETIPYFENEFYLVAKPGLIPEDTYITPANIDEYPFLHMAWSNDFITWYERCYHYWNFHIEVERIALLQQMVLSGGGMTFMPSRCIQHLLREGKLQKIAYDPVDAVPRERAYLIYMKKNTERVTPLLEHVRSNIPTYEIK